MRKVQWGWKLLAWVCFVVLPGCGGCEGENTVIDSKEEPAKEDTFGLAPEVANRILAYVDEEPVRVIDLERALQEQGPLLRVKSVDAKGRLALLESLLTERALAAEARARGLDQHPRVREVTEELIIRALATEIRRRLPEPSEELIRATYEARRKNEYTTPELRRASLIFTKDREGAEKALAELSSQPDPSEEWAKLAERLGVVTVRRQAQEVTDYFARTPRANEAFVPQVVRDAAFETDVGKIYPHPIPFEDGYYLVYVIAKAEASEVPFESVRDAIREELMDQALDAELTKLVAEELAKAKIDEEALLSVQYNPGE
ncbi:MAG: peptidylprolyl isomerase [Sandaracinaceae bacterium]|nr:peptidylprolyl isomerase [Sandaracinaceae bacterium]